MGSEKLMSLRPEVAKFVEKLMEKNNTTDNTFFYCHACLELYLSDDSWARHTRTEHHRKAVVRWRQCHDLQDEIMEPGASHQKYFENFSSTVVGLEYLIEICSSGGLPHHWVCVLCNFYDGDRDVVSQHLTTFDHLDLLMATCSKSTVRNNYVPPTRRCSRPLNNRCVITPQIAQFVLESAVKYRDKNGIGTMRTYRGGWLQVWTEDHERQNEEDHLLLTRMVEIAANPNDYEIKCELASKKRSVANDEYKNMDEHKRKSIIGLQYMIELWLPYRRVIPVFYCVLCENLTINWDDHCKAQCHVALYLQKHYAMLYEVALSQSTNATTVDNNLSLAKSWVLNLEGYKAGVVHVLQLKTNCVDPFLLLSVAVVRKLTTPFQNKTDTFTPPIAKEILTAKDDEYESFMERVKGNNVEKSSKNASGSKSASQRPRTSKESNTTPKVDKKNAANVKSSSHSKDKEISNAKQSSSKTVTTDKKPKTETPQTMSAKNVKKQEAENLKHSSSTKGKEISNIKGKPNKGTMNDKKEEKTRDAVKPSTSKNVDKQSPANFKKPAPKVQEKIVSNVKPNSDKRAVEEKKQKADAVKSTNFQSPGTSTTRRQRVRRRKQRWDVYLQPPDQRQPETKRSRYDDESETYGRNTPDDPIPDLFNFPDGKQNQIDVEPSTSEPHLTDSDFIRITDLFRNVGVDFGRRLTMNDIETIRSSLGSDICNRLLESCLGKSFGTKTSAYWPTGVIPPSSSSTVATHSSWTTAPPQRSTAFAPQYAGSMPLSLDSNTKQSSSNVVRPKTALPLYRNEAGQMFVVTPTATLNPGVNVRPKFI